MLEGALDILKERLEDLEGLTVVRGKTGKEFRVKVSKLTHV